MNRHLRTIPILALAMTSGCRHSAPSHAPQSAGSASRSLHYEVTERVPSTATRDGQAITVRNTRSFLTMSTRDSAGTAIWELVVDSAASTIVPDEIENARTARMQLGPVTLSRPERYRADIRDGAVVRTQIDGQVSSEHFSTDNPGWSLLSRFPPFASLPRIALPVQDSRVRVDTSAARRQLPSGFWNDTLIIHWRRTGTRTVDGTFIHRLRFIGDPSRSTEQSGSLRVVLAADGSVQEAQIEARHVARSGSRLPPGADAQVVRMVLRGRS